MSTPDKLLTMLGAMVLFAGVMGFLLLITSRATGKTGRGLQAAAFVVPAILLLTVGLLIPAALTANSSILNRNGTEVVGLANYQELFTNSRLLTVLRNTAIWVIVAPVVATLIGLLYALAIDKSRFEKFAKALVFLPMAISLVGASIIWKFVYAYRGTEQTQIGLLNQILKSLGLETYDFLNNSVFASNTLFLIVIMIWVQAGFAMTVLSAAIKAIPEDMLEAAKLDGASSFAMFRFITVPSIRSSLIVVLTTISIATLKVFDIIASTTAGNADDSVVAYEFFFQKFVANNDGLASALGVLLFVLVLPIVIYNVIQMRKLETR